MRRTVTLLAMIVAICLISIMIAIPDSDADTGTGQARIGDTIYPTVEDALSAAGNGDVVIVFDGAVLTSSATVKTGVTLLLPYSDGHGDVNLTGTEDNYHDYKDENTSSKKAGSSFCKCTFTINNKVTLTVLGKVIVGGILSEAFTFDYQGHTSSFHAVLKLNGKMDLRSGSQLYSYGYIRGSGSIQAYTGSSIYEPFIVTDFIGGDNMINQYDVGQSPFNRYSFSNIESNMSIQYGSSLIGLMNLYADKKFNKCELPVIGKDGDNALVKLARDSVATLTYDASKYVNDEWSSNIYKDIGLTTISISGGAEFGNVVMTAQGRTADTAKTSFSIPYNFAYVLSKGDYSMPTSFRILPGASMTVSKDATLRVDGSLTVYEGLVDVVFKDKYYPSPDTLESFGFCTHGRLIVDGGLIIGPKAQVLGVVECETDGATVTLESSSSSKPVLKDVTVSYGADHRASRISMTSQNLTTRAMSLWAYSSDGSRAILERGYEYTLGNGTSHSSGFTYTMNGKTSTKYIDQTYNGVISAMSRLDGKAIDPSDPNVPYIEPKGLELSSYSLDLKPGSVAILTSVVLPSGASGSVVWSSSDETVAVVSNGAVKVIGTGEAIITAAIKGTGISSACRIISYVDPASMSLSPSSIEMTVGELSVITATILPEGARGTIIWSSDDPSVAIVGDGMVTGVGAGKAIITASIAETNITATCNVTVKEPIIEPTEVVLSPESIILIEGDTTVLEATVLPIGAIGDIAWSTSDGIVVAVDNGTVRALKAGTARITASVIGTDIKGICSITVKEAVVQPTSVTLSRTSLNLEIYESHILKATINPPNASGSIIWSSDDESVATVSNGAVIGIGAGIAHIKAAIEGTELEAVCTVSVKKPVINPESVMIQESLSMTEGDTVTLEATILPIGAIGDIAWSTSDGTIVAVDNGTVHALEAGTARITASVIGTDIKGVCNITVKETVVIPTSLTISDTSINLDIGDSFMLTATINPSGASGSVVWSSNNKSIAIVSNGVVTALSVGTATVKAVIEGTDIIAACIVTVEEPVIEPSDIAMSQGSLNLIEGGSATLDATILPMGAIGELVWSSSDESVAAVKDGVVLASRAGIATITASVSGTDIKGVCVVTVRGAAVLPASLTLSETSHDLEIGDSFMLRAIIYPAGASGIIVWSSTDRSVATVSNGVVTATGVGIATIKAMIKGTELVAECIVTVKNTVIEPTSIALSQYTLALDAGESYELAAALLPAGSSGTIMWSSSNESVAVVENGVVHALAAGTALIIAFLENTDVTSVCQLSVADDIDDKPRTSITAEELKKGSATERELVESLLGYEGEYEGLDVDARAYSAFTIPSDVSYALASIDASITVRLSNGSIQLPSTDLKKLGSEDVSVSIVKGSIPDPYSRAYKDRPAYEVWVSTESGVPSELDYITVTFPYYLGDGEEPEKVFVAHLGDKIERIPCTFIDNKVTFSTNELSLYAIGYDSDEDDPVPPPDEPTSGLDATWLIAIAIAAVIVVAAAVFIIKKR